MLKIVLACTSGVSSEVIAEKMRAAAIVGKKDVNIEERAANAEALSDLKNVDVLLLSPQLGHLATDLQVKYPNTIVKTISTRDYSVMDGDAILAEALSNVEAVEEAAKPAPTRIALICADGFSSGGIAKNMRIAAEQMAENVDVEIEAISAAVAKKEPLPFVDVILLAPNVVFMKDDFKKAIPEGVPVVEIDGVDYGRADGKAIITAAMAAVKK